MRMKRSLAAVIIAVPCVAPLALADGSLDCDANGDGSYTPFDLIEIHRLCKTEVSVSAAPDAETEDTDGLSCDMNDDGRYGPRDDLVPIHKYCLAGALNDTGIDWCADGDSNDLECPVAGYPDQDAQYGRDVTHDDDSDGHAGFSFTKLDADGNHLPADATAWSCVRDNVTGRIWEVKTDDGGPRDKDWTYSWYNPDDGTNGGYAGKRDGGSCGGGIDCDTNAFVAAVNARGLCGANDWRMPSAEEMLSIVSNDRYDPAIDAAWFLNTRSLGFWSRSPSAYSPTYAWSVYFHDGYVGSVYKGNGLYVRLVRVTH